MWVNFYSNCVSDFNVTASCPNTTSSNENCINSPNFPYQYPSSTDCIWNLISMQNQRIKLTFPTFAVGGKNLLSCTSEVTNNKYTDFFSNTIHASVELNDYVDIFDIIRGKPLKLGRYCEQNKPHMIHSTKNKLRIKFHSNLWNNFQGFKICYEFYTDSGIEILSK